MLTRYKLILVCLAFLLLVAGPALAKRPDLILATTTSARDSGLYDLLVPIFEKETGMKIGVVAVGTGKALKLAENGDADLLLVHAPGPEKEFVEKGFGLDRIPIMHNYFIVVGPRGDPAKISQAESASEAFVRIAQSKSLFISRGDDSGTHVKELSIWEAAKTKPAPESYRETGQGMGPTLIIANELSAYTLCDKATYLAHRLKLDLGILFERDPLLLNPYSAIAVNPARHPHVNHEGALRFIAWLTSVEVQRIIASYKINGEQMFWPDAHPEALEGADKSQPSPSSPSPSAKPSD